MKVLITFLNHKYKNQLINLFIAQNPKVDDNSLTINHYVKIDYSTNKLNCYCYDLKTADLILSNVCIAGNDIYFPNELENVMFNTAIIDFNKLMQYAHNGTLIHLNTVLQEIQFEIYICEWVYANISVQNSNAVIQLKFTSFQCKNDIQKQRIKRHPLIYAYPLNQYFDFKGELQIPSYNYIYYYKYMYSSTGFKKYSKFLNTYANYVYDGLSYTYHLQSGYLKFILQDLSISYPNIIEFKSYDIIDLEYIKKLNKFFNIQTIQEITETYNLNYTIEDLSQQRFAKNDNFFEYIKTEEDTKYIYNIYDDKLTRIKNTPMY